MAHKADNSTRNTAHAWSLAVAEILGDRNPHEDHVFDDVGTVAAALEALVASGRLVATYPGQGVLPVVAVRQTEQHDIAGGLNSPRFASRDKTPSLQHTAFALEGEGGAWIINIETLSYVAMRRGQPLDRAVFHVWLGRVEGAPFVHERFNKVLQFGRHQALLLADSDVDIDWLLRQDIDVTQPEEIGKALRGELPRQGYVFPDERARKEAAIAHVKAAYLAYRGPRPRALAQGDIDVIVREGLAQGLLITLELVHAVTDGRGSPNAIYPKLADAMGRLAPRRPAADDIDPALRAAWNQMREAATAAATEALAPERAALAAERSTVEAERAALANEREQDARATTERARHQAHLEAELTSARDRIESLVNVERGLAQDLARVTAERNALQGQYTDAAAALTALQTEYAAQRETHARELAAERASTAAERDAAASARELAAAQLQEAKDRLAELGRDADTNRRALQEAEQMLADLRANLATARHDAAEADARRASAEKALAEAENAAAAAASELASTRATLQQRMDAALVESAAAKHALAALQGEHKAVVRERDRLDRLLARLRPSEEAR